MKLLIVDDAQSRRRHYQRLVSQIEDCQTRVFANAPDALAWCESGGKPDLAIVACQLPGVSGLKFLERLHALKSHEKIPILMISAVGDAVLRQRAFEAGAIDFVVQPVDWSEYAARIRNVLALRELHNEHSETADWLAEQVRHATEHLMERERQVICRMARLAEYRDPETGLHTTRVGRFAHLMCQQLELRQDLVDSIFVAAPLHDVGKIALPDYLLMKTGKLTPAEFELTKQHTLIGYELLHDESSPLLKTAAQIALSHHEHFDGAGYPHGLKGDAIPLAGRICAVADAFDVLTSTRPHRPASSIDEAVHEVRRCRGTQFDPRVVDAFAARLDDIIATRKRYADTPSDLRLSSLGGRSAAAG
jgi:putative two-component system response regulator